MCIKFIDNSLSFGEISMIQYMGEATILMVMFCALHDIDAEEKEEVTTVEGPGKALKAINLDEPCAQVHLGCVGS